MPRAPRAFDRPPRARLPRIRWSIVAAVAVGGFLGGIARYAADLAWPTAAGEFPWSTFVVNTSGAFVLAFLVVLVSDVLKPTTYLRPLLGTGFCGALTTFSAVTDTVDRLAAHGKPVLAVAYLGGSVVAGLAAAGLGVILGRAIAASREGAGR